jgi:hypothetical protein
MTQTRSNEWSGQIYNSEDGRTYSAKISLPNPDTLQVQGCVFGFLCGGENWSRVNPESTTGAAPSSSKTHSSPSGLRSSLPANGPRTGTSQSAQASAQPAPPQPQSADDICLSLVGAPGSSHQRGLK